MVFSSSLADMPSLDASSLSIMRRIAGARLWLSSAYALPLPWRLAIATIAVAAAAMFFTMFSPCDRVSFAAFYPAVQVAALLGGFVPGAYATLMSAAAMHLWLASNAPLADGFALPLFLVSCGFLSIVAEVLHRSWLDLSKSLARRRAAQRLYVANRHFQVAVSAGAIGTWDLDLTTNVSKASSEFRTIFGFAPDVVVNPDLMLQSMVPEDAHAMQAALRAALEPSGDGHYYAEFRIQRSTDQAVRWVETRGQALFENGKAVRIVGVARDVTDERAAAQALLERAQMAEQFASVAAAAPGVVFSFYIDADGHVAYRYVSPKARAVFGVEAASICADAGVFYRRVHRADIDHLNAALWQSARDQSLWDVDFRFEHPKNEVIWLEAQAAPVRQPNGEIIWHGYVSDVTERKRSEIALAESAARLQATIDGAQDAVITMDADGCVQSVNVAGLAMFGYQADEVIGRSIKMLVTDSQPSSQTEPSDGLFRLELAIGHRWEISGRRKSGRKFPAELTLSEARYGEKRLLIGFVKDLSEQKKIQQHVERLHRDRLEAMGGMAATIAHEINQPLAATATYLKVARRLLQKLPERFAVNVIEVIDKAADQTLRAGQIVRSLRRLVMHGEPDKTLESVHKLIREAHDLMLIESAQSNICVRLECHAESDAVVADKTQLKQVLVNLMRNAVDAMQETAKRELIISSSNPDRETIRVDVLDTGGGIEAAESDDCFEPFSTTKANGMGVGLAISRSIIEAHYGRIWATPNPAGGAVFSFTLPLQNADIDS